MKRQQNLGISTNCTGVFFPLIWFYCCHSNGFI